MSDSRDFAPLYCHSECGKIASSRDGLAIQKNPVLEGSRYYTRVRQYLQKQSPQIHPAIFLRLCPCLLITLLVLGQQGQMEQELATKMLQIQSKRFYLDVKQNRRGRFIKVAEIGADGRRSQIFLALSTAAEFRDHLSAFSDYYSSLGPPNPDNLPEDGKLKSEMMLKDNRRYYLDLKENSRGRFLRVSQTITRGGPRSQVAIPAQGMIEFRDALTDLLDEFSVDEAAYRQELPEGRHLHVDNKNFYFDIGQNARGVYMRISEVKTNFRTAITVPEKSWPRFRDILADYCDKVKQQQAQHQTDHSLVSIFFFMIIFNFGRL